MFQADGLRKEAETRAGEADRPLANLESEIAAFRTDFQNEAYNETRRMRLQSAAEIARMREQTEQEIAAARNEARLELKRYLAQLASTSPGV